MVASEEVDGVIKDRVLSEGEVFSSMEAAQAKKKKKAWQRRAAIEKKVTYLKFDDIQQWDATRCEKAALPLVNIVLQHSKVFTTVVCFDHGKSQEQITLTNIAHEAIKRGEQWECWQEAMLAPLVTPPKDWTAFDPGCYLDEALCKMVPLVRRASSAQRKAVQHSIDQAGDCKPDFLKALNLLQKTPLCINPFVLNAVVWAWHEGKTFGKFPEAKLLEEVPRLSAEEFSKLGADEKSATAERVRSIQERNVGIKSAQSLMEQDLTCAFELVEYDQFYLGFNLCTRGRAYPVSNFSYHRDDHIKALFSLARGKKIDAPALRWLMIHTANLYDFEKISNKPFLERELWFIQNQEKILEVAGDIEGTFDYWSKADKPFQFLACCDAYACYLEDGDAYLCGIPTALDGTNSGVQHYSAASRNKDDGMLVNLVPVDTPQDVYQKVADQALSYLNPIAQGQGTQNLTGDARTSELESQAIAQKWVEFGINRKITKRNTMCFGYNSNVSGFTNQLFEDFLKPLNYKVINREIPAHPFGDTEKAQKKAARFLAQINYRAIKETVQSVEQGMNFLKSVASTMSYENKVVRWTTPSGFPVIHRYLKKKRHKLKLYMFDTGLEIYKRKQVTVVSDIGEQDGQSEEIDRRKSMSAVSANFVHSLDSAHLLLTILEANKSCGVQDFFVIHDSFGSVPSETETLFRVVRETFVSMYEDRCVFEELLNENRAFLKAPEKLSTSVIPPKGDLDLKQILDAPYCFS